MVRLKMRLRFYYDLHSPLLSRLDLDAHLSVSLRAAFTRGSSPHEPEYEIPSSRFLMLLGFLSLKLPPPPSAALLEYITCMLPCVTHPPTHPHTHKHKHIHTHRRRQICMYVCMYVCVCIYVCIYVCMHACMYVCMCVCMCVYVCVCMCMYVDVCVSMCKYV